MSSEKEMVLLIHDSKPSSSPVSTESEDVDVEVGRNLAISLLIFLIALSWTQALGFIGDWENLAKGVCFPIMIQSSISDLRRQQVY